jgi:hypothetical protein
MSTSFTPGRDLMLQAKIPAKESLFTTFSKGHFVKPSQFTQPVKAVEVKPATFAGCFTEVYAAAPIDLDYDEPNAVIEAELELVESSGSVHQIEISVVNGLATDEPKVLDRVIQTESQRSAA